MPRSIKPFVLEEHWEEQTVARKKGFPSLASAQQDALPSLAADLADSLRSLIAQGILTVEHGLIIVKRTTAASVTPPRAAQPHTTSARVTPYFSREG